MSCWTTFAAPAATAVPAGRRNSTAIASRCERAHRPHGEFICNPDSATVHACILHFCKVARHAQLFVDTGCSSDVYARQQKPWPPHQQKNAGSILPVLSQVCPPATREDIERFRAAMTVCFRRAVDARLSIAVSPRLDDGLGIGGWRNGAIYAAPAAYGFAQYVGKRIYTLGALIPSR